jgi:DNA polymerase family A
LKVHKKTDVARFMEQIGFISSRKNRPFVLVPQITDGVPTPFILSGAQLYKEAVAAGRTEASRSGIKPFVTYYKGSYLKDESVQKLVGKFGLLPSLEPVVDYLALQVRPVEIEVIIPDRVEEVYDISVEEVHEFIANGIVVHNCTNPNVQQVPHAPEYRRCFRAPDGRKLVIADYSQIELRILAHVTEDKGFIGAFNSGADLHRVTAAQVFNTPLEDVTKQQRDFAKRLNFGVVYGIGAQRFSMMTGIPLTEAESILSRYFQTYRGLDTWLRDAARKAVRERTARTMSGRLARFNFDVEDRQAASLAQRNGKNMPIQGASADILKRALRLLHDKLKETSARVVNIVHDEIVVECDSAHCEEIARTVEEAMCAAGEEFVTRVPVKVETEIADEWVK